MCAKPCCKLFFRKFSSGQAQHRANFVDSFRNQPVSVGTQKQRRGDKRDSLVAKAKP
jgi:hypothetical protein